MSNGCMTISGLAHQCNKMKEGQAIVFSAGTFREFSTNPFTGEPPIERFKGSLIGYNYGGFDVSIDPFSGNVHVSRRCCGNKRIYHDWDRRHLPL